MVEWKMMEKVEIPALNSLCLIWILSGGTYVGPVPEWYGQAVHRGKSWKMAKSGKARTKPGKGRTR